MALPSTSREIPILLAKDVFGIGAEKKERCPQKTLAIPH